MITNMDSEYSLGGTEDNTMAIDKMDFNMELGRKYLLMGQFKKASGTMDR